jgi:hypothetical protein
MRSIRSVVVAMIMVAVAVGTPALSHARGGKSAAPSFTKRVQSNVRSRLTKTSATIAGAIGGGGAFLALGIRAITSNGYDLASVDSIGTAAVITGVGMTVGGFVGHSGAEVVEAFSKRK